MTCEKMIKEKPNQWPKLKRSPRVQNLRGQKRIKGNWPKKKKPNQEKGRQRNRRTMKKERKGRDH